MKLEIGRKALIQAIQKVQGIAEKRSDLAILGSVLVETQEDGTVTFSATDLNLSLRTQAEAVVEEPGQTVLWASTLFGLVRELDHETVLLHDGENRRFIVRSGRTQFELATLPVEDFPHFGIPKVFELIPLDGVSFKKALSRTLYAIPHEDNPMTVAGLSWLKINDEKIQMIAADGHRLAMEQIAFPVSKVLGGEEEGVTLPRKGAQELLKIIEGDTSVAMGCYENRLLVRTPDTFLSILLLEEDIPDYQAVIPREGLNQATIQKDHLLRALRKMAVVSDTMWKHVFFHLDNDQVTLEAGNPETSIATDVLDATYKGDPYSLSFNIRYVMDAVQSIETETLHFQWVNHELPALFLEPGNEDFLALVMPVVI